MPGKMLLIRLGAMGDILHASASLQLIPQNVEVHWLTSPLYELLVNQLTGVSRVWTWDKKAGWGAYTDLIRRLQAERFDVVVNWHPSLKTGLIARFSCRRVWTYKKQKLKQTGQAVRHIPRRHAVDDFAVPVRQWLDQTGQLLPMDNRRLIPVLHPPTPPVKLESTVFKLGIIPGVGAKRGNRGLPVSEWIKWLTDLKNLKPDMQLHIFGGPDETLLAEELIQQLEWPSGIIHNHVGQWSILETAGLLARCQLVIGGDTGPTHLAAAVGARVISPFGPTDVRRTGPLGNTNCLTPDPELTCWPCEKPTCHLPENEKLRCLTKNINYALLDDNF